MVRRERLQRNPRSCCRAGGRRKGELDPISLRFRDASTLSHPAPTWRIATCLGSMRRKQGAGVRLPMHARALIPWRRTLALHLAHRFKTARFAPPPDLASRVAVAGALVAAASLAPAWAQECCSLACTTRFHTMLPASRLARPAGSNGKACSWG